MTFQSQHWALKHWRYLMIRTFHTTDRFSIQNFSSNNRCPGQNHIAGVWVTQAAVQVLHTTSLCEHKGYSNIDYSYAKDKHIQTIKGMTGIHGIKAWHVSFYNLSVHPAWVHCVKANTLWSIDFCPMLCQCHLTHAHDTNSDPLPEESSWTQNVASLDSNIGNTPSTLHAIIHF